MADDPYKYFRIEAAELLDQLGQATLGLGKGEPSAEKVGRMLRYAHTLKGAARVVKQVEIAEVAHAIEDLLAPYRSGSERVPEDRVDSLLKRLDEARALRERIDGAQPASRALPAVAEDGPRTLRADVADVDAVLDGLGEASAELGALTENFGALAELERLVTPLFGRSGATEQRSNGAPSRAARAAEVAESFRRLERRLADGAARLGRELEQVRDAAERLRLFPVTILLGSLERAVRDAARELGKKVSFVGRGGDVRLDGDVLELVLPALLHVVRNAVVHGIEPEAERRAAGKPVEGHVEIDITRRGRQVEFLCRDDGRGLDTAAVRRALRRQDPAASELEDAALAIRLLSGGISTAGQLTKLSGRGVGLDVLRDAAERLGGEVTLESDPGRGFRVRLVVPFSVAAFEGLVVHGGGQCATLPLDAVECSLRLAANDIAQGSQGAGIVHEAQVLPFAALSQILGGAAMPRDRQCSALIVRGRSGSAAIGIDRLLGTRQISVRPLPKLAPSTPAVAGAAFDALGNPELVLDPDGLVEEARRLALVETPRPAARARVLVIDDSLTTRMLEQSILQSAGYEVELAMSGEEGLVKARAGSFALFLVDVEMPGMDGFTFIERSRADPELSVVPAVLVSSRSAPEDFARAQAVGARGYVVKGTFDQRELLALIRKLTGA